MIREQARPGRCNIVWLVCWMLCIGSCGSEEVSVPQDDVVSEDVLLPEEDGQRAAKEVQEEAVFVPAEVVSLASKRMLVVFDTLGFTVVDEDGKAPGFNLDGVVSDEDDEASCGQADYESPDGVKGIDNQLAKLVPLFELFGIGAASAYIQTAIEEGGLLILLQVDGIDDLKNDDEVTVMVRTGAGNPLLGTDGKLLTGQTFHLHPETPDSFAEIAYIEEGILYAGPFDARLPIVVLGMQYELTFHGTLLRAEWTYDGGLIGGLIGGGATLEDLYGIGETAAADDGSVLPAIKAVVDGAGDLNPNEEGECQMVSAALAFTGVSAFYFPDEPGIEPPETSP